MTVSIHTRERLVAVDAYELRARFVFSLYVKDQPLHGQFSFHTQTNIEPACDTWPAKCVSDGNVRTYTFSPHLSLDYVCNLCLSLLETFTLPCLCSSPGVSSAVAHFARSLTPLTLRVCHHLECPHFPDLQSDRHYMFMTIRI